VVKLGTDAGAGSGRDRRGVSARSPVWVLLALVLAAFPAPGSAADSPATVRVGGTPRVPRGARAVGPVSAASTISGAVVLAPRDRAGLSRFIGEVADRGSPIFGHYLAPGAFASRFGPAPATIDAVTSSLRAEGLRVSSVSSDRLLVNFTGSAAQVESAFHTGIESYRLAGGRTAREATSAAAVESTIAGAVVGVLGLSDVVREHPAGLARAPTNAKGRVRKAKTGTFTHPAGSPTPCRDANEDAVGFGGLTDDQIANAYGAFGLYSAGDLGAGQSVGIYELEQFAPSDIKHFDRCYFGAGQATSMAGRLSVIPVDGGQPAGPGEIEADLDVEDVSAMAPGASIDVYEAPNTATGAIDEWAAIVGGDRERVITTSWGDCEQEVQLGEPGIQQAENFLFEQAAAQGQTVFASAGDEGSDDCNAFGLPENAPGQNPLSVDDPQSQPYVVSAGGTTITDAATQPAQEQVWNDGPEGGAGGGGISMSWAMPGWQLAAKLPGIPLPGSADYTNGASVEQSFGYPPNFCQSFLPGASSTTPCRVTPDVAAQADEFTGAVTIYSKAFKEEEPDGWITIGGTSSSAPIWAAMLAEVNASRTCAEQPGTEHGVGFAAPLLYGVASNPAQYVASFNDITKGDNDIYGLDGGLLFPATSGYDMATGLGSPRLTDAGGSAGLAFYLCSLGAGAQRPVVSGLSPSSGSTAGGESVTITGHGFQAGGGVAAVQVGSAHLSASAFTVKSSGSIVLKMPSARETLPPQAPAPQDGAGPANVIVTLNDGESSATGAGSVFQYVDTSGTKAVPSVTGIEPSGGLESAPQEVTILGSGFTGASKVIFGGVPAASFKVLSPFEITASPPAFASHTACAPLPSTGVYAGENAGNDICQAQLQVVNAAGASATATILPPLEGPIAFNSEGALVSPLGCGCEVRPAPTEFDYVPAPTITSVSTSAGPADEADEFGGSLITIHGTGLNQSTMEWANFGNPESEFSADQEYSFLTGTEMQIEAPALFFEREAPTVNPVSLALSVRTQAGQAPSSGVTYAGVPKVTGVTTTLNAKTLNGAGGALDSGGTPIALTGEGFAGQLERVQFIDGVGGFSEATQFTFTVNADTSLSTHTVEQNPGLVDVQACTASGCSATAHADRLWLYPPGDPHVESISPASGPAAGGTKVVVHGQNLGCALGVFFGEVQAAFTPVETGLDCASTTVIDATSPAGKAASKVPVSVTTVESFFVGSGHGTTSAEFTYKK
jgi:Pro-kumamolisin, activation domain/IPT/TIG domain